MDSFQHQFTPQQPTSFIPKKSLVVKPEVRGSYGIFMPVALVLFFISLALYGATYFYQGQLVQTSEVLKKKVEDQQKAFDPSLLTKFQRLDSRIAIATELLNGHVTLLPFFQMLSEQTIRGLRYTGLTYNLATASKPTQITLAGEAHDYDAIALQSEIFGQNTLIKNFLFSSLSLGKGGIVNFSLDLTVDQNIFSYTDSLTQQ